MSILRRISLSLGAKADGRELPRGTSFNDLSMGAATWGDAPGFLKSPALSIPRTSVAHLLEQRLKTAECGTPRSSLDMPSPSLPTPRASLGGVSMGSPLTPRAPAAADASEPASPRSPRTPGGRRRKSGKIDGMDYYEFCELIRSSSL
ncbi:hypothetical protein ABPG77_004825 [Micractinium sp. CCAP 211/92]